MCERMNWKIPKTHGSRKKRSYQGCVVEEITLLSQVQQVVNLGSHNHLSSLNGWGNFFPVLFGPPHPCCHTLMPSSHFCLRQGWLYFLLIWVIARTKSGCEDGWKRYVTISSLIYFYHNGPIWKVSIGTGTMPLCWASSATK